MALADFLRYWVIVPRLKGTVPIGRLGGLSRLVALGAT